MYSYPAFCQEGKIRINEESEYKVYFYEFHRAFGKQMEKEFGLRWVESNSLYLFSIYEVEFYAYRRASLEEARALELMVLNRLAEEVQADQKLLSYLNLLSLSPESLGIKISFVYSHNWNYHDGSIDTVYCNYCKKEKKRCLRYTSTDPFTEYSAEKDETFSTDLKESFEDAAKLNAITSIINPAIHASKEFEDELNQILTSFKEGMKKTHSLIYWSSGWVIASNFTSDISEIRIKCTYHYPVNCLEARALMVLAIEKLLTDLNNSEKLRPYLKEYPFPASRLKLRMLFREETIWAGDRPYYRIESMESAVLKENIITYFHHIPSIKESRSWYDKVVYATESFQEAQKTFKNEPLPVKVRKFTMGITKFIYNFTYFIELAGAISLAFLFFILCLGRWLFIIPVIIIFILYMRRRSLKKN